MVELFALRDEFVTEPFHIPCYVWIGVLVNGYSCGGVRNEDGNYTVLPAVSCYDFGNLGSNGDKLGALGCGYTYFC